MGLSVAPIAPEREVEGLDLVTIILLPCGLNHLMWFSSIVRRFLLNSVGLKLASKPA